MQHKVISATEIAKGGSMIATNSPLGMLNFVYKNRFCGFPNGVSMPPKFAAIFCMIKVNAMYFSFCVEDSTKSPSGRNVSSAISFAISIEPMNVIYTSINTHILAFLNCCTTFLASI